jgi:hypothetical protein
MRWFSPAPGALVMLRGARAASVGCRPLNAVVRPASCVASCFTSHSFVAALLLRTPTPSFADRRRSKTGTRLRKSFYSHASSTLAFKGMLKANSVVPAEASYEFRYWYQANIGDTLIIYSATTAPIELRICRDIAGRGVDDELYRLNELVHG